jgi:hypothetical protein
MARFNVNKEVTKSLKFKPGINGLCKAYIKSVEVIENDVPKENDKGVASDYEYAGHKVTSLKFVFGNVITTDDVDKSERLHTHIESIIISTKNDGTPMNEKTLNGLYEQMWDRILHIHNAFQGTENYQPFDELPEINEKATVEQRVKQFKAFFTKVADGFNKGKSGNPVYLAGGKAIPCWMKLVASYPDRKWLALPTFVGEGFIEKIKTGVPPTIELKPNESIQLVAGATKGKTSGVTSGASATASTDELPEEVRKAMGLA